MITTCRQWLTLFVTCAGAPLADLPVEALQDGTWKQSPFEVSGKHNVFLRVLVDMHEGTDTIITMNQHSGRTLFPWTRAGLCDELIWYDLWYLLKRCLVPRNAGEQQTKRSKACHQTLPCHPEVKGGGAHYIKTIIRCS